MYPKLLKRQYTYLLESLKLRYSKSSISLVMYSSFGGKIIRYKVQHMRFNSGPALNYLCKLWQTSSKMRELKPTYLCFLPILMV